MGEARSQAVAAGGGSPILVAKRKGRSAAEVCTSEARKTAGYRLRALEWTRCEYWARADELSIVGESAKTERGAIKKLREAMELRFKRAAADGTLCDLLDKAGYKGLWIALPEVQVTCRIWEQSRMVMSLPVQGKERKN